MQLTEVRAIVTGGASGLGRAFTLGLLRAGASALACDVDAGGLAVTREAGEGLPGRLATATCDVRDEDAVEAMVRAAAGELGPPNALLNVAGIVRDALLVKPPAAESDAVRVMDAADWRAVVDVNLTGPFLCTRELARACLRTGTRDAVVVNVSSVSRHGNPGQGNYAAAKAGLVAATRTWALELARHGIRVAAIAPGFVDTPMLAGMRPDMRERLLQRVPLGRPATPDELFLAVRFVIECGYFTGRCLDVDGGLCLGG